MKNTFRTYSDPKWDYAGSFDSSYIPDEVFAPVLEELKERSARLFPQRAMISERHNAALARQSWTLEDTKDAVIGLWYDFDPALGRQIKAAFESDCLEVHQVQRGRGGGSCRGDVIELRCDGTLNDPVYLAHESGHLMSVLRAADGEWPRYSIREPQAFFMQEKAYDMLARSGDAKTVQDLRLHRLYDYIECLSRIPAELSLLPAAHQSGATLREIFREWSIDDPNAVDAAQKWIDDPVTPLDNKAQGLHAHPFASLITGSLYRTFTLALPEQRPAMLAALYDGGSMRSLTDVLTAFGVRDEAGLRRAVRQSLDLLEEDMRLCGLSMPSVQTLTGPEM